jgi:hypothetical protein
MASPNKLVLLTSRGLAFDQVASALQKDLVGDFIFNQLLMKSMRNTSLRRYKLLIPEWLFCWAINLSNSTSQFSIIGKRIAK